MNTEPTHVTRAPPVNLYDFALERAQESARKRELPAVATGSGVDYSWLSKFARGKIPGASYVLVHQVAQWYMDRDAAAEGGRPQ